MLTNDEDCWSHSKQIGIDKPMGENFSSFTWKLFICFLNYHETKRMTRVFYHWSYFYGGRGSGNVDQLYFSERSGHIRWHTGLSFILEQGSNSWSLQWKLESDYWEVSRLYSLFSEKVEFRMQYLQQSHAEIFKAKLLLRSRVKDVGLNSSVCCQLLWYKEVRHETGSLTYSCEQEQKNTVTRG